MGVNKWKKQVKTFFRSLVEQWLKGIECYLYGNSESKVLCLLLKSLLRQERKLKLTMDRAEVGKQCPADWLPACVSKVLLEHSQSIHLHSVYSCFCVTAAELNSGSKKVSIDLQQRSYGSKVKKKKNFHRKFENPYTKNPTCNKFI